jgi:hypothetical protein
LRAGGDRDGGLGKHGSWGGPHVHVVDTELTLGVLAPAHDRPISHERHHVVGARNNYRGSLGPEVEGVGGRLEPVIGVAVPQGAVGAVTLLQMAGGMGRGGWGVGRDGGTGTVWWSPGGSWQPHIACHGRVISPKTTAAGARLSHPARDLVVCPERAGEGLAQCKLLDGDARAEAQRTRHHNAAGDVSRRPVAELPVAVGTVAPHRAVSEDHAHVPAVAARRYVLDAHVQVIGGAGVRRPLVIANVQSVTRRRNAGLA